MPSVSVIVPAYNAASYIGEAIDSILGQSRIPDQIIVVNDGSTDDTRKVVSRYRDARIVYVEQPRGGIAAARNRGLRIATGDYVSFLDADDRWRPTMLEKQLAVLEYDQKVVCSFTNFVRFEENPARELGDQFRYYHDLLSLPACRGPLDGSYILSVDPFSALVSFGEIPCFMQVTLFRARLISGMTFNENLYLGEDYEFALRSYLRGRVAYIREVLADVRRHESNTTKDFRLFPIYKLHALRSLGDDFATPQRRAAYQDRLVKAHIEAACVYCDRGQLKTGVSVYFQGLAVPGSTKRKLKGVARLAVTITGRIIAHSIAIFSKWLHEVPSRANRH